MWTNVPCTNHAGMERAQILKVIITAHALMDGPEASVKQVQVLPLCFLLLTHLMLPISMRCVGLRNRVVTVADFIHLPHRFEFHWGRRIISCLKAIQLACGMLLVLHGCPPEPARRYTRVSLHQ